VLALLQRLRRRLPAEHGMSLIEVVVAMMIFTVTSLAVLGVLVQTLTVTRDNRSRTVAANLAAQEIDRARDVEDIFDVLNKTTVVDLNGDTFTIKRSTGWGTAEAEGVACGASEGNLRYKRVNIEVGWENMRPGSVPARADTVIDPSQRINDPSLGTIIVGVTNAAGVGVGGVTITGRPLPANPDGAQSFETAPAVTDAEGCTYIIDVEPGNYELTASKGGYIDVDQETSATTTVGVKEGNSAGVAFSLDQPGDYDIRLAGGAADDVLIPRELPVTFVNPNGSVLDTVSSSVATRDRTAELYPMPDGYQVVPDELEQKTDEGDEEYCLSPDASQWVAGSVAGTAYAQGENPTASPGDRVDVPMGIVSVRVAANTDWVYARREGPAAGSPDPGCTAETQFRFRVDRTSSRVVRSIALPWGTWRLSSADTPTVTAPSVATGDVVTLDPRRVPVG
jgi:prepilin-type N-terminal cleavage/methylation domain-containing protein